MTAATGRSASVRTRVWERLRPVARPDSRFHLDFAEVIPDFEGSEAATARLLAQPFYDRSRYVFITPDNGLALLRERAIEDDKTIVVSTYGIRRGFVLIEPGRVPPGLARYASWLDGLEHFGRPITLSEIAQRGRFDCMVTGASAVSLNGVRFGKGHGFFDLEWGMFTEIGIVDETTPVCAMVHDVQIVEEKLEPSETDILVDSVVTPSRFIDIARADRPRGVHWEKLQEEQIAQTPPLGELRRMQGLSPS